MKAETTSPFLLVFGLSANFLRRGHVGDDPPIPT